MSSGRNDDAADRRSAEETLAGDTDAFRGIVERYTPLLYSLSLRMGLTTLDAEDAVQEIFERLFSRLDRYRPDRPFHPWLYTIALNVLRSRRRTGFRRGTHEAPSVDPAILDSRAATENASNGPERRALLAEGERIAAKALDGLPASQRVVFVLRQFQDQSVEDTAKILGLPEGTVKTLLHRARRNIERKLAEGGWP